MILIHFQGKTIQHQAIQVYVPTTDAKKAEVERLYEDLQDILELTPEKDVLFILGDWNAKVGNQEISGITSEFDLEYKRKQGKGYQSLPRECTGHNKHPIPTTQEATLQ